MATINTNATGTFSGNTRTLYAKCTAGMNYPWPGMQFRLEYNIQRLTHMQPIFMFYLSKMLRTFKFEVPDTSK